MDTFFTGLLLAMVPFIAIIVIALIKMRNQEKDVTVKRETDDNIHQRHEILTREPTEKAVELARRTTSFLSPYIGKSDETITDEVIVNLWDALNRKFSIPETYLSVSEFAVHGAHKNVRSAFENQLSRVFREDTEFAEEIETLLQQAQTVIGTESSHESGVDIVINGDVSGQISIGRIDVAERLAGDETTDAPPPKRKKK